MFDCSSFRHYRNSSDTIETSRTQANLSRSRHAIAIEAEVPPPHERPLTRSGTDLNVFLHHRISATPSRSVVRDLFFLCLLIVI